MSSYSFNDPITNKVFTVKVPSGVTEDQARSIFQQQLTTGSLAGFDVGTALSAATQAAGGLESAKALVSQAAGLAAGKLPVGSALNTISSSLGPGGLAGATQAISSLQGQGAALASNAIGGSTNAALAAVKASAGSIGDAVNKLAPATNLLEQTSSSITGALRQVGGSLIATGSAAAGAIASAGTAVSGVLGKVASSALSTVTNLVTSPGTALAGAAAAAGSLASNAVKNLAGALSGPVTNPINVADMIKQGVGGGLPDLSAVSTQSAMSAAAKLVGQPHKRMTDNKGAGKFGFDLDQLETAGYVKPGTAALAGAAAAAAGTAVSITSVLKSPTAFTGKDGIKSVSGLLNNENLQNNIQKGLMDQGLGALKSAGVPLPTLNPNAIAGLANNAAKSVGATLDSLKGTAPADVKSKFDAITKNTSFAVTFGETRVPQAVVNEVTAKPAEDTVNNETLDAAAKRVVGNDKVPTVSKGEPAVATGKQKIQDFLNLVNNTYESVKTLEPTVNEYEAAASITQAQFDELNNAMNSIREAFNSKVDLVQNAAYTAPDPLPAGPVKNNMVNAWNAASRAAKAMRAYVVIMRDRIKALAAKITLNA